MEVHDFRLEQLRNTPYILFYSFYRSSIPDAWNNRLDDFQKLLVLKCIRPDKVTNAMQMYLSEHLGQQFVEPQTTELTAIYQESSPTIPLVFVLSTGTDPAAELYKFAEKLRMGKKLQTISLGQGQGPRAELMLQQSTEIGNWVFFQVIRSRYNQLLLPNYTIKQMSSSPMCPSFNQLLL